MLAQLLVNGFVTGCSYSLVALGFGLIYNTTRVFHFAHGAVYVLSAYVFYTLWNILNWQFAPALVATLTGIAIIGILIDQFLYQPLANRKGSPLVQMLSSLGLYIATINVVAMIFGNETKVLVPGIQPTYSFGTIILTQIQVVTVLSFILLFGALAIILHKTNLGITIRAMRDDPDLLSVMGVNPRTVRCVVFSLGSVFAAVAAVLNALDVGMDPNTGLGAVLNGTVAVIIGGVGIFEGAALGGIFLGLIQSLAIWQVSARWQDAIAFLLLILFLIFRPEGVLGLRRRTEETST